jgi:hypothetical protein
MPLPLAFPGPASPLPIAKTRIRNEPLAADPTRPPFVFTFSFHRFLPMTLRKQWSISFRLEISLMNS